MDEEPVLKLGSGASSIMCIIYSLLSLGFRLGLRNRPSIGLD